MPSPRVLLWSGGAFLLLVSACAPERGPDRPAAEQLPAPFWNSDSPDRPNRAPPVEAMPAPADPERLVRLSPAEERALAGRRDLPAEPSGALVGAARPAAAAVPTRIVTGLYSVTFHQENETTLQPQDLTGTTLQALVPRAGGGFDVLPGVGHDDGTFSIRDVPVGNYWLSLGLDHVWTSADHVEWVFDAYGRADAVYPGTSPTDLVVNAANLSTWQASDELFWAVPNQGIIFTLTGAASAGDPSPGDTALSGYTLDFALLGSPLLDAARGDQGYLAQLDTRAVPTTYRALGRVLNLPALTMTDGAATPVDGGFLGVAQASTMRLNWRRSLLADMTAQVSPSATVAGTEVGLWVTPLGLNRGVPLTAFQLLTHDSGPTTATTDVDLGDAPYGNPFPSTWSLLAETYFLWDVSYLAPGATTPVTLRRSAYTATPTLPTATAPIAPLLGPVRNARVNGKDLFQNQLGVGTSPTLTWDAPSLGAPTSYIVRLMQISNVGGLTRLATRGFFYTNLRSVTLPPGLLVPGAAYVCTITSRRNPGVNSAEYPFRSTLPFSSAPMMSAIFAP